MKIMTLNIWGGKLYEPLTRFLERYRTEIDIFCFQEVYNGTKRSGVSEKSNADLYAQLEGILSDFDGFHSESIVTGDSVSYGIAMFVKKEIPIMKRGVYEIFSHGDEVRLGLPEAVRLWNRLLQFVTVSLHGKDITIFNFHGLWTGGDKLDTQGRQEQSEKVRSFMQSFSGAKVLCGDFNLDPDTQSMGILEDGMQNLIKKYHILSTRSHLYVKEPKFADYILTSPDVQETDFKVLDDVVSDHLPLAVDVMI